MIKIKPDHVKRVKLGEDVGMIQSHTEQPKPVGLSKGIKIAVEGRSEGNHYADQVEGVVCSECFHFVALAHRFCWWCGCTLSVYGHSGTWDDIAEYRKIYQEEEKTGWEEEKD